MRNLVLVLGVYPGTGTAGEQHNRESESYEPRQIGPHLKSSLTAAVNRQFRSAALCNQGPTANVGLKDECDCEVSDSGSRLASMNLRRISLMRRRFRLKS